MPSAATPATSPSPMNPCTSCVSSARIEVPIRTVLLRSFTARLRSAKATRSPSTASAATVPGASARK